MKALLVLSTFPDAATAREIATRCVDERLAACANLLPGVESIYQWQGKIEQGQEVLALFKTTASGYAGLEARIKELHPYDVPEVIAFDIAEGLPDYLHWIAGETKHD